MKARPFPAALERVSPAPGLPFTERFDEVVEALGRHQVLVVCGETGSGKTTQLPKACLAAGRGRQGLIGHTQPRRIAARSVAARLAEELGVPQGSEVGFQVRFNSATDEATVVKVMTDGILLAEIRADRLLTRYDTLILDEAHERSLNIDFLLGYLKQLLPRRPDLKLVVTSATLDPERIAAFLGDAPIIEVSGRGYPIEVRHLPLEADAEDDLDLDLNAGLIRAVSSLLDERSLEGGDILCFLPGEREIHDAARALQRAVGQRAELLPLFSRLSWQEQRRVFERGGRRRIILSTNVAETSLTVPGVRAVVDSGLARIARYSPQARVLRLPVERVSRASADQRAGRCGRTGPGICIRLYAEADYEAREAFTPPEIQRTHLASVILQMAALGLGEIAEFPFPDPPDLRRISDGVRLLQELRALDAERRITPLGRKLARLPLDPRLGAMLAEAACRAALPEALVVVAFLSIQDPRERPLQSRQAADEKHREYAEPGSDFLGLLRLHADWKGVRAESGSSALRRWCRERFLSAVRMREWEALRSQLEGECRRLGWRISEGPPNPEGLHRSLLVGLLGQLGRRTEQGDYLGPRGLRFQIAPGPTGARRPPWLMAASLVDTGRVQGRLVASIRPDWIEAAAPHLIRREHGDPRWDPERGAASVSESVSYYGLGLGSGRRVPLARLDPALARRLLIEEGLLAGQLNRPPPFLRHNVEVRARLEQLEDRVRRRGVLVDEALLRDFYEQRLPVTVGDLRSLLQWLHASGDRTGQALRIDEATILRQGATRPDARAYPEEVMVEGLRLRVTYRFDPHADDDGATLTVPLVSLGRLQQRDLDWGVPGWRHERVTLLIKGLPKSLRRHLVPAPDVAETCLARLGAEEGGHFFERLAQVLTEAAGMTISPAMLLGIDLPAYLRYHLRVVDQDGRMLGAGRDLEALQRQLAEHGRQAIVRSASAFERHGLRKWDIGELPLEVPLGRNGEAGVAYPALEDGGREARLTCFASADEAEKAHRGGVLRLLTMVLEAPLRHVRASVAKDRELPLLCQPVCPIRDFVDALCDRAVERACLRPGVPLPRNAAEFEALYEAGRPEVYDEAVRIMALARDTLDLRRQAVAALGSLPDGLDPALVGDCRAQLDQLAGPGFMGAAAAEWLEHLPRYLRALLKRIARLPQSRGPAGSQQVELLQWRREALGLQDRGAAGQLLLWMTHEYCVSLFAQELRTSIPVSAKRLARQVELAREARVSA
ncbi:MAG: ATP-dependent RNA helicase HrpA [Steroidobacteraceae bacterium]